MKLSDPRLWLALASLGFVAWFMYADSAGRRRVEHDARPLVPASTSAPSDFEDPSGFVHPAAFPLVGAHAGHACTACHASGTPHDLEALAGPGPKPTSRTCGDCHSSPHSLPFMEAVAREQATSIGASCAACHDAVTGGFGPALSRITPKQHALTGFPLDSVHAGIDCAACHDPGSAALVQFHAERTVEEPANPARSAAFAERFPGRSLDDCAACH